MTAFVLTLIGAALACGLEMLEALAIVLAVGSTRSWRDAVLGAVPAGGNERRTWEAATLLALRGRLRSGDIWVEGSRQWRAVDDQLIAPALFQAIIDDSTVPRRACTPTGRAR